MRAGAARARGDDHTLVGDNDPDMGPAASPTHARDREDCAARHEMR